METNKRIFTMILLMIFFNGQSQSFEGIAFYKSHIKIDYKSNNNKEISSTDRQIHEELSKQLQREYVLIFNNRESLYKQDEKLKEPSSQETNMIVEDQNPMGVLYKNIKENRFVREVEFMGKRFLVKDSLVLRKWVLEKGKKNIGEYVCYKATFEMKHTVIEEKEGAFKSVVKNKKITVWYTLQIPISNGPSNYEGLPGLILEINDGKTTLVCSKIILNPKKEITIKEPVRGKKITQDKFDTVKAKKNKEMLEKIRDFSGAHTH